MLIFDTIAAECTAPYKSALSVIRLSGPDAFKVLSGIIRKDPSGLQPRRSYFMSIYKDKDKTSSLIDRGVIIVFKGPASFTGEDTAEFYVHGSRIIVDELMTALVSYGARRALGGEFSAKAYYNGRLDLTEAEAINQLINAKTARSKDFALKALGGEASKAVGKMKKDLDMLTAEIEVDIDYPEFDEEADLIGKISSALPELISEAKSIMNSSRQSRYLFNGIKIAIVGEPNVGKSTLLNKIIGEDKAIVTDIPGTTRDVVEGEKEIDGMIFRFYDTAGIRRNAEAIELMGIQRSYKACQESDIVLILSEKGEKSENIISSLGLDRIILSKPVIYVATKTDLHGENPSADISISKNDKTLDGLYKLIERKLAISSEDEVGLTSERDLDLLSSFIGILDGIKDDIASGMTVDVVEIKLIEAVKCLDEMLGNEATMEDIYQTVFKNFCVGK